MHYDGSYAHIHASGVIDQVCPLSPCGFAAAIEPISRGRLDDGAKLWAYLDDWHIWIKPQHITEAVELISTATRTVNLELQPTKIQTWTASCNNPIQPAFQDKAKSTLKCLGAHLRIAGDSEGSPVELGGRPSMQSATQRFRTQSSGPQDADDKRLAHHVCRGCQPTRPTHDFRVAGGSRQRRHLTIISPPVTYGWTRGGLRSTTTCCSPMDSLSFNHTHPHGSH